MKPIGCLYLHNAVALHSVLGLKVARNLLESGECRTAAGSPFASELGRAAF